MSTTNPVSAPPLALYLTDIPRAVAEYGQLVSVLPLRRMLPVGDGHPVLVLPGLLAGDGSTWTLRRLLRRLGYRAHGWGLGRNIGPTPEAVRGMELRLDELHARYDVPLSLIGWSLGGIFARALARRHPSAVRQVITLGSPFRMEDEGQTRATPSFKRYAHLHSEQHVLPLKSEAEPMPVPATAIYSRFDGMVAWQTCINPPGPRSENIAVLASHIGYGHHPATVWAIADRLAQPRGSWTPFRPPAILRPLFPAVDWSG
ncbi:esterase/lipase family protein [Mycobacterium ostraviense]|uniref:Alpha/beta hydrolase n=1 Tax=Mycobacterium ostraviense TaxID=2738409 RepID=A0A163TN79_9MYCO|nr:alpha/beta hydrolase [Mycobacterium ostraviense]KZS55459.1 alpha/beta hydrolase [Mycobacterium ostraviense]UGT92578.1 alpha/beta hydrolase [Mycobacterium ostraviense]